MGVWIETQASVEHELQDASRPTWACGLKLVESDKVVLDQEVTPHVGVWIETACVPMRV